MIIEFKQQLSQFKAFWKVRRWLKTKLFSIARDFYSLKRLINDFKQSLGVIVSMFRGSLVYFVLPAIIASITQLTESPLRGWFASIGWVILKDSDYATLVATVTSISGLFIGLYYAAVTSIGGAIYAKVPQSLRQLLLNERYGNTYLRYLVFFTFLGMLFLAQYVLGYRVNPANIPIITLLGGFAVFAFFQLGIRALSLFEPTQFAGEIFSSISTSVLQVVPGSGNWKDPSFQKHEQKTVQYWLESIEALSEIASSEKHLSGKVFVNFIGELTRFLHWYEFQKDRIPRNSEWFKSTYEHPDWYQTSDTQTSFAYQAGSILEPHRVREYRWLENELSQILLSCLEVNLSHKNYPLAMSTLNYIEMYVESISSKGDISWAGEVIKKTSTVCEKHINKTIKKESEQSIELIGLCDAVATLPINLYLAFVKNLERRSGVTIFNLIKQNNWYQKNFIYKAQLSENTIKKLEWLQERMLFEYQVEKNFITPTWYLMNEVCKEEASSFVQNVELIVNDIGKLYGNWVEKLTISKRLWLASACSVREKEFWHKIRYQQIELEKYWNSLKDYQKHDSKWADFYFEKVLNDIDSRMKSIDDSRTAILNGLLALKRPENFPDFPGLFLHSQGEALFDALTLNDTSKVARLFHNYFYASFYKFSEMLPKDFDEIWKAENKAKIASAALIDLLELTGYGIVLCRFHGNTPLESLIKAIWSAYLDQDPGRLKPLLATVNLFDGAFEIPHRNEHRFHWERFVSGKLSQEVETKDVIISGTFLHSEKVKLHKDPLVRIFAQDDIGMGHKGIDVFVTELLVPRLENPEQEIKSFRRDLRDDIEREVQRYKNYIEDGLDEE